MANALNVFKKFYSELTTVVPMIINDLVTKLYSDKLLSGNQKSNIDSLATGKEKTVYFLDEVIKPSLEIDCTKLFDEILKIMESSDDAAVHYLADKMHKFSQSTSSSVPSVDHTQTTQNKGNHCGIV